MHVPATEQLITPVILAGGHGRRLWPLSSEARPKPFQDVAGEGSLFRQTLLRLDDPGRFTPPLIVGNAGHRDLIEAELAASGIEPAAVILEPEGRNTAPAVALAALVSLTCGLSDYLLVLPSDHYIRNPAALAGALDRAEHAASLDAFVTFGIKPAAPETCYGYIRRGGALVKTRPGRDEFKSGIFKVARFFEKPPMHRAQKMFDSGNYLWNSGMFLFPVALLLQDMQALRPDMLEACQASLVDGMVDGRTVWPALDAFLQADDISIDRAIMEKTKRGAVVPVDLAWSDVGSWSSVWQAAERDRSDNAALGNVILKDVKRAYVRSEGPVTAVVGLEDVIVVNTGDAVIVTSREHAQDVQKIAERVQRHNSAFSPPGAEGEPAGRLDAEMLMRAIAHRSAA